MPDEQQIEFVEGHDGPRAALARRAVWKFGDGTSPTAHLAPPASDRHR